MDLKYIGERLAQNADAVKGLVGGVGPEQARWQPTPGKWSLLEIINHLGDEERDDFRKRLDLLLHHPDQEWPGIDPEGWCVERKYNERELEPSLEDFLAERQSSIAWLRTLENPAWENSYQHPLLGEIKAGSLLNSWLAHDLLHIRQLTKLHFDYFTRRNKPYSVDYAGKW
jgi:hypothetical protein